MNGQYMKLLKTNYLIWKIEQHILTPKYYILNNVFSLVKHYHVTEEDDDDKPLKITFQCYNAFVICAVKNGELL